LGLYDQHSLSFLGSAALAIGSVTVVSSEPGFWVQLPFKTIKMKARRNCDGLNFIFNLSFLYLVLPVWFN
jgi:hypothetical protein